jgi:hypothetical protein
LKEDGTVWGWGSNLEGQLGTGNLNNTNVPVQVGTLTGIVSIDAGGKHILALKNDGTLWACGTNDWGEFGNGTTTSTTTPVQISTITGVIAIQGSQINSMSLKNDGTVWTWGDNSYGQLGNGNNTNSNSPVQVNGLCSVIGTNDIYLQSLMSVCPNPSSGKFQLMLERVLLSERNMEITVSNMLQQKIYRSELIPGEKKEIDISNLSDGIYFLSVETEAGIIKKKLVLNR